MKKILCIVTEVCEKFVPKKSGKKCPQIPRDRRVFMRKRCNVRKQLRKTSDLQRIVQLRNKIEMIESELIESHIKLFSKNIFFFKSEKNYKSI